LAGNITHEVLFLPAVFDLDRGLSPFVDDLEGEVLHVRLNLCIIELASDETLGVKYTVGKSYFKRKKGDPRTYVLWGFMAIWFLAASPMSRSLSEKET